MDATRDPVDDCHYCHQPLEGVAWLCCPRCGHRESPAAGSELRGFPRGDLSTNTHEQQ